MQFICSVNSKVVNALDVATGKIEAGGDFRSFNNNWEPKELDALSIADEVGQQKGLCAWHLLEGKRIKDNTGIVHAGLIIIDIDKPKNLTYVKNICRLLMTHLLTPGHGLVLD